MVTALERSSLQTVAREHADIHKWIVSEKARCDQGVAAYREWVNKHWHNYVRHCWLEHILGKRFWIEFKFTSFGILQHKPFSRPDLVDLIMAHLEAKKENLDIIQWSFANRIDLDQVLEILEAIDINSCHMACHLLETCGSR